MFLASHEGAESALDALTGVKGQPITLGRVRDGITIDDEPVENLYLKQIEVVDSVIVISFTGGSSRLKEVKIDWKSGPEPTEDGFMLTGIDQDGKPFDCYFILN